MSFILLFIHMALVDIIVQGDAEQGEVLTVTVVDEISKPVPAETVRVTMHPGMSTESQWTLGITDVDGIVSFTPSRGGPFAITVGDQAAKIDVSWRAVPRTALAHWFGIALVLCVFGVRMKWAQRP